MNKCVYCEKEIVPKEVLNVYNIDFSDDSMKKHIRLNCGIQQGIVKKAGYCEKCRKFFIELEEL
nr:hypothetical protein [uncultured Anaerosporobacter sp.]